MEKMYPVVHFEMPAKNRERMARFYSGVFGWQTQMFGEEMGNYVTVATAPSDNNGRPTVPGTINGGFFPVAEDDSSHHPSVVIAVEDINLSAKEVSAAGGKLLGEPVDIPGVGLYLSFKDPEGNTLSLLQPKMG